MTSRPGPQSMHPLLGASKAPMSVGMVKLKDYVFISFADENYMGFFRTNLGKRGLPENAHRLNLLTSAPRMQWINQLLCVIFDLFIDPSSPLVIQSNVFVLKFLHARYIKFKRIIYLIIYSV